MKNKWREKGNENDKLVLEGEYREGKRTGKGKKYYLNILKFERII
jgi:hypothetical protein